MSGIKYYILKQCKKSLKPKQIKGYSDFFVVQLSKTGMPVRNQVRGSMNAS